MARQAGLARKTRYRALSRGVKKRWMTGGPVSLDGKSYTPQQVVDELDALLDAHASTAQAYAAWRSRVLKQRALEKRQGRFVNSVESAARLLYGDSQPALADFGLEPVKKPGPKTAAVKAAAAEKGQATRKRRGTMGPRQKKKVKAGT